MHRSKASVYRRFRIPSIFSLRPQTEEIATSEWGRMLGRANKRTVLRKLIALWPVPNDPEVAALRQRFLTYTPQYIEYYHDRAHLTLNHPKVRGHADNVGDAYHFSPPALGEQWESLEAAGRQGSWGNGHFFSPQLAEFYRIFPGLREDLSCSGNFIPPGEWVTLEEEVGEYANLTEVSPWGSAIEIYHARDGKMLLMNECGAIAWYNLGENMIIPLADDFSGFLRHFCAHLDKRYPFDGSDPSDDEDDD